MGGLSAAAILARQGFPVTLVEQHDRPGGYATSFERDAGRFDFEVSLHATSTSKGGPMKEVFEAAGILETVPMVAPSELARIVTPFPGLYVSSAWSSGGGYMPTIVSGLSTATRLLKDFG